MSNLSFFNSIVEKKLMDLHVGYIGRVMWTDGITAKVQPLNLIKQSGSEPAKVQAIVSDVPVACRYKIQGKTISYIDKNGSVVDQEVAVPVQIAKGDLVACLCADRDIASARRGKNDLPPAGRHSISDSIIVGILEEGGV